MLMLLSKRFWHLNAAIVVGTQAKITLHYITLYFHSMTFSKVEIHNCRKAELDFSD